MSNGEFMKKVKNAKRNVQIVSNIIIENQKAIVTEDFANSKAKEKEEQILQKEFKGLDIK